VLSSNSFDTIVDFFFILPGEVSLLICKH
jgi:hypothetical protein